MKKDETSVVHKTAALGAMRSSPQPEEPRHIVITGTATLPGSSLRVLIGGVELPVPISTDGRTEFDTQIRDALEKSGACPDHPCFEQFVQQLRDAVLGTYTSPDLASYAVAAPVIQPIRPDPVIEEHGRDGKPLKKWERRTMNAPNSNKNKRRKRRK
jgi:hypothetical protein